MGLCGVGFNQLNVAICKHWRQRRIKQAWQKVAEVRTAARRAGLLLCIPGAASQPSPNSKSQSLALADDSKSKNVWIIEDAFTWLLDS